MHMEEIQAAYSVQEVLIRQMLKKGTNSIAKGLQKK